MACGVSSFWGLGRCSGSMSAKGRRCVELEALWVCGANLKFVNLTGAALQGADLRGAIGLNLEVTTGTPLPTKLPHPLLAPAHGLA